MFLFVRVLQHTQTCTSTDVHCKPVCCTSLCCTVVLSSICKALLTIHSLFQSSFTEIYVFSKQAKSHCVLSSKHLFVHWAQCTVLQLHNFNLSTQQTTKPHTNAAALTPSVSVTSTLPSASSSMSLWMLRMASKLSRAFSSWQRSSSIPHSSEERKKKLDIRQVHLNYTIVMLQNLVS